MTRVCGRVVSILEYHFILEHFYKVNLLAKFAGVSKAVTTGVAGMFQPVVGFIVSVEGQGGRSGLF